MRATVVVGILLLSTAAIAQTRGRVDTTGRPEGSGTIGRPIETPKTFDEPNVDLTPDLPKLDLGTPKATIQGSGPPPLEPPHSHGGHAHSHDTCRRSYWVCGQDWYVAGDNYELGTTVSGIHFQGYWVPGPCQKECEH
jgi:hypothetical protein